jgi:hypothetical protein
MINRGLCNQWKWFSVSTWLRCPYHVSYSGKSLSICVNNNDDKNRTHALCILFMYIVQDMKPQKQYAHSDIPPSGYFISRQTHPIEQYTKAYINATEIVQSNLHSTPMLIRALGVSAIILSGAFDKSARVTHQACKAIGCSPSGPAQSFRAHQWYSAHQTAARPGFLFSSHRYSWWLSAHTLTVL